MNRTTLNRATDRIRRDTARQAKERQAKERQAKERQAPEPVKCLKCSTPMVRKFLWECPACGAELLPALRYPGDAGNIDGNDDY